MMTQNKKLYFVIALISIIWITVSLATACQPTPDEDVITPNDVDDFKEMVMVKNDSGQIYDNKEHYCDEFLSKDGKVTITIDADVETPSVDKLPVIKISPSPISEEMTQWASDEFLEGEDGYYPTVFMNWNDAEELKLKLQGELMDEEKLYEKYGSAQKAELMIDYFTKTIEFLDEYSIDTSLERAKIPATLDLRTFGFYSHANAEEIENDLNMTQEELKKRSEEPVNLYVVIDAQLPDDKYVRLGVYNEYPYDLVINNGECMDGLEKSQIHVVRSNISMNIHPSYILQQYIFSMGFPFGAIDVFYPDLTRTMDESVDIAVERLEELGIDNFYVESTDEEMGTSLRCMYDEAMEYDGLSDVTFEEYCESVGAGAKFHRITFKPYYYGVPLLEANQLFYKEDVYYSLMEYEVISMRVAEDCIAEFKWINPTDVSNVLNDNVKIVSLDTAIKNAKQFMELKYNLTTITALDPDNPDYDEITATVNIDSIKLGLGGIPAYDSTDEYLLIPVWSFYGSYSVDSDVEGNIIAFDLPREPFVSVNAINGSIIHQNAFIGE